jgi:hypothetical protein
MPTDEVRWIGRLRNWKFEEALKALPVLDPMRETLGYEQLEALALTFGNCGWIDGHMATLIEAVVKQILQENRDAQSHDAEQNT